MLTLADVCHTADVHLTTYATGCIFHYDKDFPEGSGKGFKEGDKPNFTGSYYSYTKALVESLLREYPRCLVLRVRMPIVGDLLYPRNFVTKILKYDRIVNIPNSMTVLPELLPLSVDMAERGLTGIMNFTNPGAISHNSGSSPLFDSRHFHAGSMNPVRASADDDPKLSAKSHSQG